MPHQDDARARLGPLGIVLGEGDRDASPAAAADLEDLGFPTVWLSGPRLDRLDRVVEAIRATHAVTISTAIIAADLFSAQDVGTVYRTVEAESPGRFLPALGGAHGVRPRTTMGEYFDVLDHGAAPIPIGARLLSALGPRMLDLAAHRAAGAVPVLATTEYTAWARARLGPEPCLAVEQFVVLDGDPPRARDAARELVGFLRDVEPGYRRHFVRMGFTEDEIAQLADRLVDALVAHGDLDGVARRIRDQHTAGADHVALLVIPSDRRTPVQHHWRELGRALLDR